MKSQYTPGPWTVGEAAGRLGMAMIDIEPGIGAAFGMGRTPTANARLMTAAPDGLALAQMIETAWGARFDAAEEINGGDVVEWLGELIPAARALIAKAIDGAEIAAAPPPATSPRLRKVCETCGSVNVSHDALASWCEGAQEWEIRCILDNADCDDCGGETTLEDVEIDDAHDPVCACQNCDYRGLRSHLKDIRDYHERVEHGEDQPDGECPHCGALAHAEEERAS